MVANIIDHRKDYAETHLQESKVRDFFSLLKPRVMSLVIFTGIVGLFLAPGTIHPLIASITILCIALGSGAAGAINMWYDRDIDAIMQRTSKRPIPSGKVSATSALEFGVCLASLSVFVMAIAVNLLAGALLLLAILYYVLIYTMWLKRSTPQNIVIGGGAGAFPPMIGWAAVTGNVTLEPIILFTLIFFWTPPHFWALSLYKAEDYSKAGVPMLPVVKGVGETKKQILIYTFLLAIIAMLPAYLGMSGIIYLISAILLNAFFIYYAISTYYNINRAPATFGFSILYLFLLFGSLMVDKIYFYHLF